MISERIPIILASEALKTALNEIEENTKKGVLPPKIQNTFINDLLEEGVCICGRSLDEDENCRKALQQLLENTFDSKAAADSNEGKYTINTMLKKIDFKAEYDELWKTKTRYKDDLKSINDKLEDLSSKISAYDEEEIKKKEKRRNELRQRFNSLNRDKGKCQSEIDDAQYTLDEYDKEIKKIKANNEKSEKLQKQYNYVISIINVVSNIRDSIVEDVRKQLEKKTREYFYGMIWKTNTFDSVHLIDEGTRYRFSVTQDGQECLGDLSSGEKQILALAFSAALHSISGYSVPVFIDTPLGRISEDTRDKVAQYLPKYLSDTQLIILPTDTEYTEKVRSHISEFVGLEYKIIYNESKKMSEVVPYE